MKFTKKNKKHTGNRWTLTALCLALLLSLTACGSGNGEAPAGSGKESTGQSIDQSAEADKEQTGSTEQVTQQPAVLTLADGEAKLIYAKDNYAVAAFHGPDKHISASFCNADGESLRPFVGYGHPSDGWTLIISKEFSDGYDYTGIGVNVTDHAAEKTADGTYPEQSYLNIEQMSAEEMKEIGLDFLDGHCCVISDGRTMYSGNSFGLTYGITWLDDYYFVSFKDIEGFADRFSYYAGDGTPLDEYFEGYSTLEITTMNNMFDVMLIQDEGTVDEAKNKSMCNELKACAPYLIYTGLDGTEQRFDLLTED